MKQLRLGGSIDSRKKNLVENLMTKSFSLCFTSLFCSTTLGSFSDFGLEEGEYFLDQL